MESDGTTPYGNLNSGISLGANTNIQIGGSGVENVIAHNTDDGIVTSGDNFGGHDIRINSYFCNGGLAINMTNISPLVSAPVITANTTNTIGGTSSEADGSVIEVYEVDPGCADNQGAIHVGSTTVNSGAWSLATAVNFSVDYVATVF